MATIFGCCKPAAASLEAKAVDELLAGILAEQEQLHRNDAVEFHVPRAIDHSHPAAGNLFDQFVISKVAKPLRFRRGAPGITCRILHSGWRREIGAKTVEQRI